MGKQPRNYSDLIQFAVEHPELSRTKAIKEFRKQGGEVQKQAGLNAFREYFELDKGQEKQWKIQEIIAGKKETKPQEVKEKKPIKKEKKPSGKGKTLEVDNNIHYERSKSKYLLDRIDKLYGHPMDKMFGVRVKVDSDEYTLMTKKSFQFFIPYDIIGKDGKIPAKKFYRELNRQAVAFYSNMSKNYDGEYQDAMKDFQQATREMNSKAGISPEQIRGIYKSYGIDIEGIDLINYN